MFLLPRKKGLLFLHWSMKKSMRVECIHYTHEIVCKQICAILCKFYCFLLFNSCKFVQFLTKYLMDIMKVLWESKISLFVSYYNIKLIRNISKPSIQSRKKYIPFLVIQTHFCIVQVCNFHVPCLSQILLSWGKSLKKTRKRLQTWRQLENLDHIK